MTRPETQFTVTLPNDLADLVELRLRSGAYASAADLLEEGLRALFDRDAAIELWLREEVVALHRREPRKGGADAPSPEPPRGPRRRAG